MKTITKSVGKNGKNLAADITTVQQLLNTVPVDKGGPTPPFFSFGATSDHLVASIIQFQKKNVPGVFDGRVDPGGKTLIALNRFNGESDEILNIVAARQRAAVWLTSVPGALAAFKVPARPPSGLDGQSRVIDEAFRNHFKIMISARQAIAQLPNARAIDVAADTVFQNAIAANFLALATVVSNGAKFIKVTDAKARADRAVNKDGSIVAAYFSSSDGATVKITSQFFKRGPNCRAAIILHESVHAVDSRSGDDPIHISEWATAMPPINNKFGNTGYDRQTPEQGIHNPSAYASFAAHVATGRDQRFGDGRLKE